MHNFLRRSSVTNQKMATLRDGVLLKLLENMASDEDDVVLEDDRPKPSLLQIRGIIPVLEEGGLWPNGGFFLKVADSTHALYVSLSEEQNEMILGNKLKLGQFIYVQKLKKSDPVPLMKEVTPIPGRRPCEGTPEDIISSPNFVKILEASKVDSMVEKGVVLEKKILKSRPPSIKMTRASSDTESLCKTNGVLKSRSSSASKAHPVEIMADKFSDFLWPRNRPSSVDNDSDGDSVVSSCSSRVSKRRSWQESEILGVKEIFDSTVRHDIKLPPRSRSANVSPVRSVRYDSSDDNLSSVSRRRSIGSAKRVIKSSNRSQAPVPKVGNNVQSPNSLRELVYDIKGAESGILWSSLPSVLVKLGKEVARQRDNAVLAAADALQEACVAERLLDSLSTLSQFPQAEGDDDLRPPIDRFLSLHQNLASTTLLMHSLTTTPPSNLAGDTLDTRKNAIAWLKSAVALDLSTLPTGRPAGPTRKSSPPSKCFEKSKKGALLLGPDRKPEWGPCAEMAACLQEECGRLLLGHVEGHLAEVDRRMGSSDEGEVAAMMYKVKMVSDWLDSMEGDEVGGAHERARSKIYGILLKHVERTAMAFDHKTGPN